MKPFPRLSLADGKQIPQLGLGIYKTPSAEVPRVVRAAVELGYRHFDTATLYENEDGLGRGVASAGVTRDELYLTSKVLNADHGYESTLAACVRSIALMKCDYLDLYLIHWPAPRQDLYVETWRALEKLKFDGLVMSIGVSNFHIHHLERLAAETQVTPVINQIECHPWLPQNELREHHRSQGIATEAWSPLARGRVLRDRQVQQLAISAGRTPAQIVLRWQLQRGVLVIPKSVHPERMRENSEIFDFELNPTHMRMLDDLETGERTGADPDERD